MVTGSGKYFRKIQGDEEKNLGIVRIAEGGERLELLWGLADGGAPTSELATHLRCHAVRRRADPAHRVIMHCHPEHLIAMELYVHSLGERELTRSLWRMGTECLVVFPEGIGALPWMVCGGEEIARASAEKMADCRLLLWAHHGVFGAGETLDETYGLIETAEKAAEIYLKIAPFEVLQTITDEKLAVLGEAFGVCPRRISGGGGGGATESHGLTDHQEKAGEKEWNGISRERAGCARRTRAKRRRYFESSLPSQEAPSKGSCKRRPWGSTRFT